LERKRPVEFLFLFIFLFVGSKKVKVSLPALFVAQQRTSVVFVFVILIGSASGVSVCCGGILNTRIALLFLNLKGLD